VASIPSKLEDIVALVASGVLHEQDIIVLRWSLHTTKGQAVLKLQAVGERTWQHGDIVSHEDFLWADGATRHPFRAVVKDVRLTLIRVTNTTSLVGQNMELVLEKHALVDSGQYKPRTVKHSHPDEHARKTAAPKQDQPDEPPSKGARSFIFDE
jgi:hypothetical protein